MTGATGFVGTRLVNVLAAEAEVWAMARAGAPKARAGITWVLHDLTDRASPRGLPERTDVVVHLAQSKHFRDFPEHATDIFEVNVDGTLRLLEYARLARARCFVYASTGGLYGVGPRPFRETDPPAVGGQLGFYFASKYAAEMLVQRYSAYFSTTILRPFFIYGAGQHQSMLLPRLAGRIVREEPVTVQGPNGGLRINPLYVSDAVAAIRNCFDLDGHHLINLAGAEIVSIQELARRIGYTAAKTPNYEKVQECPAGHVMGDISRMTALLGAPRTSLDRGLTELCKSVGGITRSSNLSEVEP